MSSPSSRPVPLQNYPSAQSSTGSPVNADRHASPSSSSITSTYSRLSLSEVAQQLSTSPAHGLSPTDARTRLLNNGPNELPHEEQEPLWLRFVKQFKETLILLLLASAAISALMGNWDDAISIAIAVTIVVSVAFVQEYRSEKSIEALNRLVPHYAHLTRGEEGAKKAVDIVTAARDAGSGWGNDSNGMPATEQYTTIEKISSTVPASQLVPGDLVLFSTGDRIPADIRITLAADLSVDESNLTGENEPVRKDADALEYQSADNHHGTDPASYSSSKSAGGPRGADLRLNEQKNIAFMGTLVRSGYGQGLVVATGSRTEFGAISASLTEIESPRTPLQLSMDRLGQELSYMSFGVIVVIVVVGIWQGRKLLEMFTIGVSLAVAAIPEGLPIIVTVTLALGVLRMARRGAIVRRLPSVETLGSVNVICSDKTGTLTTNRMTVTKMWHFDLSDPIEASKIYQSSPDSVIRMITRIGNLANNARHSNPRANSRATDAMLSSTITPDLSSSAGSSRWVGQPTDVAMLDLLDHFGLEDLRDSAGARVAETPFSSERKWMGVKLDNSMSDESGANNGGGSSETVYIKGALELVLNRCDTYMATEGCEVVLDGSRRKLALDAAELMASEGLRVLGFASGQLRPMMNGGSRASGKSRGGTPQPEYSPVSATKPEWDENYHGLVFAGLVGMKDPPRPGVENSIQRFMAGGVKVIMITGDSEATALAIAKRIGMGISQPQANVGQAMATKTVLTGNELDHMTERELAEAMSGTSIFARTSPDHKMKIVRALQSRGDVVAMTGDGVNDAPALKKADIGVAMGLQGTDVAKEAADMILTNDDFTTILHAIEEGKGIFYNIQNFLTFQLSTSVAALSLVLLSTMFGLKNPLNAMQILWINILMDGPPAQSLGVEPVDPAVMTRPPRARSARVLTRPVIRRVLISATTILVGTMITYIRQMSVDGQVTARDTTMTFTCFVLFDMFNALTCRSERKSFLRSEIGLFTNKMFNYAVAASLAGQTAVIYLPFLQRIFQTESLSLFDLLGLVVLASSVFWVDETRKWIFARHHRRLRQFVGSGSSSTGGVGGYSTSV